MWQGAGRVVVACFLSLAGDDLDFADPPQAPTGPPRSAAEMEAAKAYLTDWGTSLDAPRVTFDVLMAAAVEGNKATVDEMRTRLIFEHAGSVQQRYLLTTLDAKGYRELLAAAGDKRDFTTEFAKKFCRAIETGYKSWGTQFLTEDTFLLRCGLAAQLAKDKAILDFCRTSLTRKAVGDDKPPGELRQAAAILFDDSLANVDKCLRLHAIEGNVAVRRLSEHFDGRLTEELRHRPDVAEARIERLIEANRFADAIPEIEALIESGAKTAKLSFCKGWCQVAVRNPEAVDTLRSVPIEFPDDPWSKTALEIADAAAVLDQTLADEAEIVAGAVQTLLKSPSQRFELQMTHETEKHDRFEVYMGLDATRNFLEVSVRSKDVWLFAFRNTSDGCRLLLWDDPSIHQFAQSAPLMVPVIDFKRDEKTDTAHFNATTRNVSSLQEAADVLAGALKSLDVVDVDGVRIWLDREVAQGGISLPVIIDDGGKTLTTLELSPRKPGTRPSTLHVTTDQKFDRFATTSSSVDVLRYGPADAFELSPPAWPDKPVVEHATFEMSFLFQALTSVTKAYEGGFAHGAD